MTNIYKTYNITQDPITTIDIYPRSHPSSPTPRITQCSVLLLPPSLALSPSSLGILPAPPLVSPAAPVPLALAPPVSLVRARSRCGGKPQRHRLQPHAQPRSVGAGRTAAGAGEGGAGIAAGSSTPRFHSSPSRPPSGQYGRS